jgi:hypothetical protein
MLRRTGRHAEYMAAMKDIEWLLMGASQETRDALFGDDAPSHAHSSFVAS